MVRSERRSSAVVGAMPLRTVAESVPVVKVSRRLSDVRPDKAKYRFRWGDGCFFTMLASTVKGISKRPNPATGEDVIEFDDDPVPTDAPECWLWVRLLNNLGFDDEYAAQFPGEIESTLADSAKLGKWSIAFNLRSVAPDGTAEAHFVDEWWKEIESTSCSGTGKIVARYIMATRQVLATHAPQIRAAPAQQSAVCDPLKYDVADRVPSFDGVIDDSRIAALRPIYDELKRTNFTNRELEGNTVGAVTRKWTKEHGPLLEAVRKRALRKLFESGAWRINYFQGLGGSFPSMVNAMPAALRLLLGVENVAFSSVIEAECEARARDAYVQYEAWRNRPWTADEIEGYQRRKFDDVAWENTTDRPNSKNQSDDHFESWFRSELYLENATSINNEMVLSRHPLHLTKFYLDVVSAGAELASKYAGTTWFKNNKVERVVDGRMP